MEKVQFSAAGKILLIKTKVSILKLVKIWNESEGKIFQPMHAKKKFFAAIYKTSKQKLVQFFYVQVP